MKIKNEKLKIKRVDKNNRYYLINDLMIKNKDQCSLEVLNRLVNKVKKMKQPPFTYENSLFLSLDNLKEATTLIEIFEGLQAEVIAMYDKLYFDMFVNQEIDSFLYRELRRRINGLNKINESLNATRNIEVLN